MVKKISTVVFCLSLLILCLCIINYSNFLKGDNLVLYNIVSLLLFVSYFYFYLINKSIVSKSLFSLIFFAVFLLMIIFFLDIFGVWNKVSNADELKNLINSTDNIVIAAILFITIQFLQVTVVPIPGSVTTLAGTLLFGPFWGGIFSIIGIVLGSITAFIIGRTFGYRLVRWIIGDDELERLLKYLKGRDKVMFTMIILLPFFPDDILCFVAGLTTMSLIFFAVMIFVTRIITVFAQTYVTEFAKIIFGINFWLGVVVCAVLAILMMLAFYLTTKYGEKIQAYFKKQFTKVK